MKRDERSNEIVELLTRAGAIIAAPSRRLLDETMHAARRGDVPFLRLIRGTGIKLDEAVDSDGRNILHHV